MSELSDGFKMLIAKKAPSHTLLVPLLRWVSNHEKDIEMIQRINTEFFRGNQKIYIYEVALTNNVRHFIPYPKKFAIDKKLDFFYGDLSKFFGWTKLELRKNLKILDLDSLKEIIAKNFGYDKKERKLIGLKKRET